MPRTFHQIVLKHLLAYRENNPDFIFIPRQANRNNRFEQGYCFQGTEGYAFVGLINKSGGINKTRSVGLVFYPVDKGIECHFEIVHKGESDEDLIRFYDTLKEEFNHGKDSYENQKFISHIGTVYPDDATELFEFLDIVYPKVIRVAQESGIKGLFISESKFEKLINKIEEYDKSDSTAQKLPQLILVNLTWNSKDWKEPTVDDSNHRYVQEGNVPGESWNFKKDASWNDEDYIYGYAQFTNQPTIQENLLLIFYSQGKIVGFYGDAEIGDFTEEAFKNLSGLKDLSFVLENKIDNIKEKGFLEDKERIGQIGFTYLQKPETFDAIIEEAIRLNPKQALQLDHLKTWYYKGVTPTETQEDMNQLINALEQLSEIQVKDYFNHLDLIVQRFDLSQNDERLVFNIAQGNCNFHIGQRYVFILSYNGTTKKYGVISKNRLNNDSEAFKDDPESTYFNYYVDNLNRFTAIDDHLIAVDEELQANVKSSRSKYDNLCFREMVFNDLFRDEVYQKLFNTNKTSNMNPNTILYS